MTRIVIDDRSFDDQETFVAQGRRCATPVLNEFQKQRVRVQTASLRATADAFVESLREIEIPVHFHVIHDGGKGLVTEGMLDEQIAVVNTCYGVHGIQFTKASVTRTEDARLFKMTMGSAAEREGKTKLGKDTPKALNFYTAGIGGGLLGWATFPSQLAADPALDGVVILHSSLPGGASAPYDQGKTAVHEIGHWLGLYHTFEGGCAPPGDEVQDTPAEASPNFGPANLARDTCPGGGKDPVTNYMDYTDDAGMNEFTPGQLRRIREQITLYRPGLIGAQMANAAFELDLAFDLDTGVI